MNTGTDLIYVWYHTDCCIVEKEYGIETYSYIQMYSTNEECAYMWEQELLEVEFYAQPDPEPNKDYDYYAEQA